MRGERGEIRARVKKERVRERGKIEGVRGFSKTSYKTRAYNSSQIPALIL